MITIIIQFFNFIKNLKKKADSKVTATKVEAILPDGFDLVKLSKDGAIIKIIAKTSIDLNKEELLAAEDEIKYAVSTKCKVRFMNIFVLISKDIKAQVPKEKLTKEDNSEKEEKKAKYKLDNFKQIIAISSCKGGVGKSTIAFLLAKQLANQGQKVAFLDLDIYGPSVPSLIDCYHKFAVDEAKKLVPVVKDGIHYASVGFVVEQNKGLVWRGPMITKLINSLILNCAWDSDFDTLIVDMPPGTGDAHLSFFHSYSTLGTYLVCTDSKLACSDIERSIDAFKVLNVPILGLIQNMSDIFNDGILNELCNKHEIEIVNKIPFTNDVTKKNIVILQNADLLS
jgi:ATP-binding protein involved in chromosome partitioning